MHRRALLTALPAAVALKPRDGLAAGISVIASFSILADMTRRIGGDLINVTSLVPPDADVHMYQPTGADLRALTSAAMLVENGLGLEGWITRLGEAAGFRAERVIASRGVTPRMMREGSDMSRDPHAWQDPRNGMVYIRNIAAGLARADPANVVAWRTSAGAYRREIEQTDAWIEEQFASIPSEARRIVTTHDAFGYDGDRYGVTFVAAEGISTDAEPSAKGIAALVTQIKREKVRDVFLENMTDPRLTRMLARETGARVSGPLYSDALSKPDGPAPDYITMLRYNTSWFLRALRPT